jgi:hypothetical protein
MKISQQYTADLLLRMYHQSQLSKTLNIFRTLGAVLTSTQITLHTLILRSLLETSTWFGTLVGQRF